MTTQKICLSACSAGTYRTLNDVSCLQCPRNTIRTVVAAGKCNCINGFYRNDSPLEGADVSCTGKNSDFITNRWYS